MITTFIVYAKGIKMSDPVTMGMGAAGTMFGGISSIVEGNTQSSNYLAQAQAADYNAAMQRQQAQQVAAQGTNKQNLQQQQATKMLGEQKAAIGQSNLGFSGTMADIMDESEAKARLDQLNIAYDTNMQSNNLIDQANMSEYQANIARNNASRANSGGWLGAAGKLFGGGAKYIKYRS